VLKALSFMFEYIGEMGKDYIYAVTPLLQVGGGPVCDDGDGMLRKIGDSSWLQSLLQGDVQVIVQPE
jgi:hypothetical protein